MRSRRSTFQSTRCRTWNIKARPKRLDKLAAIALPLGLSLPAAAAPQILWQIAWFFTKAGAFVFGSGLAIVPFLYGGVVKEYQWLFCVPPAHEGEGSPGSIVAALLSCASEYGSDAMTAASAKSSFGGGTSSDQTNAKADVRVFLLRRIW